MNGVVMINAKVEREYLVRCEGKHINPSVVQSTSSCLAHTAG
jgi:hypothetical protein